MTLRVLIVEDMATYRTIIARSLAQIEDVEVLGKVANGKKALDWLEDNEVDLITLDVEMPIMDGLSTLKELKNRRNRAEVVMLSGLSDQAAHLTIECLELGAIDFVLKPQTASFVKNQNQLVERLTEIIDNLRKKPLFRMRSLKRRNEEAKAASKPESRAATPSAAARRPAIPARRPVRFAPRPKILVIGISTGGPKALAEVFEKLEGPLGIPVLIVQHMPAKFTKSLAESLNKKSSVEVVEAVDGDVIENNTVYIAPGGYHMILLHDPDFGMVIGTNLDKPVNSCRPAVDVLFNSVAPLYKPGEVAALIMTGMGRDGADGCVTLAQAGAYIATQSEETCTIYGMPKSVEDLGIQNEVLDLDDIAPFINRIGRARPALQHMPRKK